MNTYFEYKSKNITWNSLCNWLFPPDLFTYFRFFKNHAAKLNCVVGWQWQWHKICIMMQTYKENLTDALKFFLMSQSLRECWVCILILLLLTKLPGDNTPLTHTHTTAHSPSLSSWSETPRIIVSHESTTYSFNKIYRFYEIWVKEIKCNKKKVQSLCKGGGVVCVQSPAVLSERSLSSPSISDP